MQVNLADKPRASYSSFESLFENNNIQQLPIELLLPFENQPFKPYSIEKITKLSEDIAEHGVISPVIVMPRNDGTYTILAGHNRTKAASIAQLKTVPCLIKNCDDKTAKLIMVNSNLNQRDELLPSERAFAYKIQKECSTVTEIAAETEQNRRQVQRYLRLTFLNKGLLERVDSGRIPFVSAVELSYISPKNQQELLQFLNAYEYKVIPKYAKMLRNDNDNEQYFSEEYLLSIFSQRKKGKIEKKNNVIIKLEELQEYFPERSTDEIRENVLIIIKLFFENNN